MRMRMLLMFIILASMYSCNTDNDELIIQPIPPIENDNNENDKPENPPILTNKMKITIGTAEFTATLADNSTAEAFKNRLPLILSMDDYGNNEKVASIESLPTNPSNESKKQIGDIMLWGSTSLVLFYENFSSSYSYTRIGKIDNITGLCDLLDNRNSVTLKFEIE